MRDQGKVNPETDVSILKAVWGRDTNGQWGIRGMKGLSLKPRKGFDPSLFQFEDQPELLNSHPGGGVHDVVASFGFTNILMQQSILPVVAWVDGESTLRRLGTAAVISCSGYLMTAGHVLLDPKERGYGDISRSGHTLVSGQGLHMGVLVPRNPVFEVPGFNFFPFERCWFWGEWTGEPSLPRGGEI